MTEPAQYTVGDSVIVSAHEQKDLGVIVTDDLSWSCHYNKICKKAYLSLHLIKRALPASASVLLKKQLFISLVRSHFSYCSQLWKPLHVKDILSLERVQRRATKFILNDYVSDYKTRLRRLSFLPLSLWLDLRDVMFLVKCLQSKSDDSNFNILIISNFVHLQLLDHQVSNSQLIMQEPQLIDIFTLIALFIFIMLFVLL